MASKITQSNSDISCSLCRLSMPLKLIGFVGWLWLAISGCRKVEMIEQAMRPVDQLKYIELGMATLGDISARSGPRNEGWLLRIAGCLKMIDENSDLQYAPEFCSAQPDNPYCESSSILPILAGGSLLATLQADTTEDVPVAIWFPVDVFSYDWAETPDPSLEQLQLLLRLVGDRRLYVLNRDGTVTEVSSIDILRRLPKGGSRA